MKICGARATNSVSARRLGCVTRLINFEITLLCFSDGTPTVQSSSGRSVVLTKNGRNSERGFKDAFRKITATNKPEYRAPVFEAECE